MTGNVHRGPARDGKVVEPLDVTVELILDPGFIPSVDGRHYRRDPLGALDAVIRFEGQQKASRHDISEGSGEFLIHGEDHFSG